MLRDAEGMLVECADRLNLQVCRGCPAGSTASEGSCGLGC